MARPPSVWSLLPQRAGLEEPPSLRFLVRLGLRTATQWLQEVEEEAEGHERTRPAPAACGSLAFGGTRCEPKRFTPAWRGAARGLRCAGASNRNHICATRTQAESSSGTRIQGRAGDRAQERTGTQADHGSGRRNRGPFGHGSPLRRIGRNCLPLLTSPTRDSRPQEGHQLAWLRSRVLPLASGGHRGLRSLLPTLSKEGVPRRKSRGCYKKEEEWMLGSPDQQISALRCHGRPGTAAPWA